MNDPTGQAAALLERLASARPVLYDLGTPDIGASPEMSQLVELGPQIAPYLLQRAEVAEPRVTAYAVHALAQLGDRSMVERLARLRDRYEADPNKDPWKYAVVGQCRLAIAELQSIHSDE